MSDTRPMNLVWLQSGGCGGCSLSLFGAEAPDFVTVLESAGIDILWHPSLSEQCGEDYRRLIAQILNGEIVLDFLCLEGAVIRGPNGSGRFHIHAGSEQPMKDHIAALAERARYVVSVGTCAAYGGITAAGNNEVEACGLQYDGDKCGGLLSENFVAGAGLPVVNVSGCPTHPNWVTETLAHIAHGTFSSGDMDELNRPRSYTDQLVHHGCPRNEFYEFKASAEKPSDLGCLMENIGCLGTQARADCNTRLWNGSGSCLRGGYACINCTAPEFEEPGHPFMQTPKVGGIPVGLPTDMPKAWFVALASLSKAATPKRLRKNAVSDRIVVPPGGNARKES